MCCSFYLVNMKNNYGPKYDLGTKDIIMKKMSFLFLEGLTEWENVADT